MLKVLRACGNNLVTAALFTVAFGSVHAQSSSCPTPAAPFITQIPGTNAVLASFDASGGPYDFYAQGGPTGFTPVTPSFDTTGSGVETGGNSMTSPIFLPQVLPGAHDFYLTRFCFGMNAFSNNAPVVAFTMPACDTSLPWAEGFEDMSAIGPYLLPSCWYNRTSFHATGGSGHNALHDPRTGGTYLLGEYANNGINWTPGFYLEGGASYDFSFYYTGDGDSAWTGKIYVNNAQQDMDATQLGADFIDPSQHTQTTYAYARRSFTPAATGTYYFGTSATHDGPTAGFLGFDDFAVDVCSRQATISIAPSATSICIGMPVTFTATTQYTVTDKTIQWYKNGIVYPHSSTVYTDSTLTSTDVIQAIVISYDPDLCKDRDTSEAISINVVNPANTQVALTATPACARTPITLTINSSGLGSAPVFGWYKNGSLLPGKTNSTLVLDSLAVGYVDTYFGFADNVTTGCVTDTLIYTNAVRLESRPYPTANIRPTSTSAICENASLQLRLYPQDTIPGNSFQWNLNGSPIPGATGTTYAATLAGSYTATVSNASGCTKTSPAKVLTTIAAPVSGISASGPTHICPSGSVTLNASSVPGATFRWYKNGMTTSTTTASNLVNKTGSYMVASTANGCTTMSDSIVVVLHDAPNINVVLNGPAVSCAGTPVTIDAMSDPDYSYQWYRSSVAQPGATSSSFAPTISGTYKVGIQNYGCGVKYSPTRTVTINQPAAAVISITSQTATLAKLQGNNGTTLYDYQWFHNGGPISGATVRNYNATQNGIYTLSLTTKTTGCADTSNAITATLASPGSRYAAALESGNEISIYPNPSDGLFYINAEEAVNATVKDVQGRTVLEAKGASAIDLSAQPKGIYMLMISDTDGNLLKAERLIRQ
jgi:hypothetical protein